MYENYVTVRDEKGLRDADVAKMSGITKSTFVDWKNGRSQPKQEKLKRIADCLDVTVEFLRTGSKEEITTREKRLIAYFRGLSAANQKVIENAARALSENSENDNPTSEGRKA